MRRALYGASALEGWIVARRTIIKLAAAAGGINFMPAAGKAEGGIAPITARQDSLLFTRTSIFGTGPKLVRHFHATYPSIDVNYVRQLSTQLYEGFLHDVSYNVLGSYARERALSDPNLGVVVPDDYALFYPALLLYRPPPRALTWEGYFWTFVYPNGDRQIVAAQCLGCVRHDVRWEPWSSDGENARPIRAGPELLTYLDRAKHANLIRQWRRTVQTR